MWQILNNIGGPSYSCRLSLSMKYKYLQISSHLSLLITSVKSGVDNTLSLKIEPHSGPLLNGH
jgi:hypothetical protein